MYHLTSTIIALIVFITFLWAQRDVLYKSALSTKALVLITITFASLDFINSYIYTSGSYEFNYWFIKTVNLFAYSAAWIVAIAVVNCLHLKKWLLIGGLLLTTPVIPLLFVHGTIHNGVTDISTGYTRVPGPYYWMWQVGSALPQVGLLITLIYQRFKTSEKEKHRQLNILLSGFGVATTVALSLLVLMQLGVKVNGIFILSPFLMLVPAAVLIVESGDSNVRRLLGYVPWTEESRQIRQTLDAIHGDDIQSLPEAMQRIELQIIQGALDEKQGNKTAAAEHLKISRSTINRKVKQSKIP